jgi:hypothetical protein
MFWPIIFQLIFLNFHYVPKAIFKFLYMWSRSERRVIQLAAWTNAVWWLVFIRVQTVHWPLVLRLVWHQCLKFCHYNSSLFQVLLLNGTITGKSRPSSLAMYEIASEPRTLSCPVTPLPTHWWQILSHNSVTEIKKKLTHSKVCTELVSTTDRTPTLTI